MEKKCFLTSGQGMAIVTILVLDTVNSEYFARV